MTQANATVITGIREIADRFDHVLLDQWGALHEGVAVFPEARDCVQQLKAAGKRVIILSNSGRRSDNNAKRIADLGLPTSEFDSVLTSGEVVWHGMRDRKTAPFNTLGRRALFRARGDPGPVINGIDIEYVEDPAQADFIWLAGLDDPETNLAVWPERLRICAARKIPLLCANPDVTMFTENGLLPAPGAVAEIYQNMGGTVHFFGKPHPTIYAVARQRLGNPPPERVVVIGDSLDHDVLGGRNAGMLAVLISSGIHAQQLAGVTDLATSVRALAKDAQHTPHWTIERLRW